MKIYYESYPHFILDIYTIRKTQDLGESLNNMQGVLTQLEDNNNLVITTDIESISWKYDCSLPAKIISRYGPWQTAF